MRGYIRGLSFVIVGILFFMMVLANSGPVFWQGYPSSEVMSIEENSPIIVKNENLVFDFSDNDDSHYTISGKVTAAYDMVNPTNESLSVNMAFPFVGVMEKLSGDDIVITADGSTIPYTIYAGDVVNNHGSPRDDEKGASFEFADILGNITDIPYKAESFRENEKGKLYTLHVRPTTDQRINLAVDFRLDHRKTKVLTRGFNRYEREAEKTRVASWCYEPEVLEIYVLGEDIDLNINAYSDGELSKKTDLFDCRSFKQEVDLRTYLMSYIEKETDIDNSVISDAQLYNLYAEALDRYFTKHMGFCSEHDLMAQRNYERIFTLVYTVEFPPEEEKEVSVTYNTSGTMDMRETSKPLYTFDYILNPAENWKDFKNLNINIIPPEKAPYIVRSSIDLIKGEDNIYSAVLADLPEEDLFFTLYEDSEITILDKVAGKLHKSFGYLYPFAVGIFILAAGIITGVVFKLLRRQRYDSK